MKKIIVVLVVAMTFQYMMAQAAGPVVVPQAVSQAFTARFPDGQLKKWETRKEGFVAVFREHGKTWFAYYTADGSWKGTETPIKWTKNLPQAVRAGWLKSDYASWYVQDIKSIRTPEGLLYALHVDNSSVLDSEHKDAFREEYVIFFNEKGEIVRTDTMP